MVYMDEKLAKHNEASLRYYQKNRLAILNKLQLKRDAERYHYTIAKIRRLVGELRQYAKEN